MDAIPLRINRIEVACRVTRSGYVGSFPGFTIYGAIKSLTAKRACQARQQGARDCRAGEDLVCAHRATCVVGRLFQATSKVSGYSSAPNPFVLRLERPHDDHWLASNTERFSLTVIGKRSEWAVAELVETCGQLTELFARSKKRGAGEVGARFSVEIGTTVIPRGEIVDSGPGGEATILFQSPIRIELGKRPLAPSEISVEKLVRESHRRLGMLARLYGERDLGENHVQLFLSAKSATVTANHVHPLTLVRRAGDKEVRLKALHGSIDVRDLDEAVARFLGVAAQYGIGKATTTGLGSIAVLCGGPNDRTA